MEQESFLPSKRFIIGLLALVVVGIGFLVYRGVQNRPDNNGEIIVREVSSLPLPNDITVREDLFLENLNDRDSDGDGVPDWLELLYGLDPNNPNTTADDIGDLEDLQIRRDIVAGTQAAGSEALLNPTFEDRLTLLVFDRISRLDPETVTREEFQIAVEQEIDTEIQKAIDIINGSLLVYNFDDFTVLDRDRDNRALYIERMTPLYMEIPFTRDFGRSLETFFLNDIREPIVDQTMSRVIEIILAFLENPIYDDVRDFHIDYTNTLYKLVQLLEIFEGSAQDDVTRLAFILVYETLIDDLEEYRGGYTIYTDIIRQVEQAGL
jgi:hypothetical protein